MFEKGKFTINDKGEVVLGGGLVGQQTVNKFNEEGIIAEGITGLMRSTPAMMTGPLRMVSFYAMGSEVLDEEMNKIPEFAEMSENEKLKLKVPLGLVVAGLEEFGLRSVLSNSSIVSRITLNSLRAFGKKAVSQQTTRTFNEVIKKEIANTVGGKILKGTILTASAGLAEYETGALQEVADIYGKEIYDAAKGVDYFDNVVDLQEGGKEAFNMEVITQANRAGLAEMVGGIVMGMPGAVTQASQNNNFEDLDAGRFALFREISKQDNVEDYLNYQKAFYNSAVGIAESPFVEGELLTQEEADFIITTYEDVIALSQTVRPEYAETYQKKIMNLVAKRRALQKQVDTFDKATTKEQQRQIELINEDIAELTFEADKELAESTREYDKLKAEGKVNTDFISWRTKSLLEERVTEAAKEQVETQQTKEQTPAAEVTEAVAQVGQESREDMEKRAKKELIKEERQRRAKERKEFKGQKVKGQRRKKYVPTQDEINAKVEGYIQEQEAQQEAQLLAQQIETETKQQPTEQVTEQPTEQVTEQPTEQVTEQVAEQPTEQSVLDEEWNNELQTNKDAFLKSAEKQLKEEKGPGRRRMLIGRRRAPVITQEEILQRAKENLYELNQSLREEQVIPEEEVSSTTPTEGVTLIANPTRSEQKQGNVYTIQENGQDVGEVMFTENSKGEIVVQDVEVSAENQKKGIATKAYQAVNEMVGDRKVVSSTMFVEEGGVKPGEKLWESLVRNNLAKKTDTGFEMIKQSPAEGPQFRTKDKAKVQREQEFREAVEDETGDIDLDYIQATGRLQEEEEEFIDRGDEVFEIVNKMNKMESGNVGTNLDTTAEGVTINTQEVNDRTDNELPTIANLQIVDGVPTIFTISDQLTTGSVVNPQTGNTIDNLRGGLGFTGTEGNENAAWANTTEKEATDILNKAFKTYEQNKEVFHKWWKANPEFSGHIPMAVVKMGETSILSNEATFRVLRDNLTKIPVKNRKNAVKLLKQSILDKIAVREKSIKTGLNEKGEKLKDKTIKNYKKEVKGHKETLKTLAKVNPKTIDDVLSQEFIETLSLPARKALLEQVTFGQPNKPGESTAPSRSNKAVPAALIEGMNKDALELVHLGPITDLITEPQLKNVPQRNIVALQAVEIGNFNAQTNKLTEITLDEAILNTKHPNYGFGTKGKTIGLLENPVSVVKTYPQAFANAMSGLVETEAKGKRMSKSKFKRLTKKEQETAPKPGELEEAGVGKILTETLGVQNGLPNEEFIGAIAQQNITKEQQLMAFMNQSFPGVVISTDQETFDNVMKSKGINKKFVNGKVVYGVTLDGDIYINPEVHNTQSEMFNTAIHEMGHVWQTYLMTSAKGKKIYKRGVELVKQTAEYQRQLEVFDGNEEKAAYEAMAVLIGNKGETIAEAATKSKFKEWLLAMWKYIHSTFKFRTDKITVAELQNINLDDFLGMALADIFSGKPVRGKDARSLTKLKNPEAAFSSSQSMQDVIIHGRKNGFSDAAIKIYLQSQGYTVAEIKDALTINRDLFDNTFPPAFANVPGGVNEGTKMYDRTLKKIKRYIRQNNPSLKEIQEQAQLFLKRDKTFKTYNDTLQQSLLIALNSSLEINQSSEVAADIKRMKETLKQRRKGAKELSSLQTQLRVFLRKNFPRTQWESKEVLQLITEVTNAKFYKDFENLAVKPDNDIRMVMDKVSKVVMQKRVDDSIKKINKRLSIKTQKLEGARKKGVNFLPEAVERIQQIKEDLAIDPVNYNKIDALQARLRSAVRNGDQQLIEKIESDLSKLNANATFINEKIESLRREFEELSEKNEITDEIAKRMHDIDTAILYNEALLMENDNPNKADTLVEVDGLIKNMLSLERDAYNEVIRQAKERYNRLKSEFLEDVSGVEVDYNSEESVREGTKKVNDRSRVKNKQTARKILNFLLKPTSMIMKRIESVEGLVSRISKGQGEMFGGKSAEIIGDRLNESRRTYKGGKREMNAILKSKAEEIFGKNYVKVTERNQRRNVKIILDKAKHDKLVEQQKKAKTKREKRELQRQIDSLVEYFSQNEMYYLYNQNKDAANRPGLASKKEFAGYNINEIMQEITSKLDPKVKQWADWQVNEFFPSVYERYNTVYKKIYRTNMPWNANYAGRVVREDMTQDPQDIMSMQNQYRTNVGSQSSMIRIQNSNPIMTVSGDNILNQYIDEMEYFRGYGESMRDISKIYNDPLIKQAIITYTDKDTYNVLRGQLEKVIQRRNAKLTADHPIFTASTSAFAISKLGLNPTVMLKQMTSSLAFADYIGYRNWAKYAGIEVTKGFGKWNTTWQEMYDNSPELQDRYSRDDFAEAIESYQSSKQEDILGGRQIVGLGKSDFNKVRNFLMYMVKTGDMGGVMGSIPNYAYYKDQYKKKNPNATEQQAIDFAIRKTTPQILSTQQSSDIQDKDHFSTDSAVMRSLQLFTSSPRALFRKEMYAIREIYRKMYKLAETGDVQASLEEGKGTLKDNIRTFVTYHFVVPMFFKYVSLGLPGIAQDWDDDDTDELFGARQLLLGNIESVFVIGDLLAGVGDAVQEKPWAGELRSIPLLDEASGLLKNYMKYNQSKTPETKEKYLNKIKYGAFNLVGIPARQISQGIDNLTDIGKGDYDGFGEFMLKLLNYSDYVQEGGSTKKESSGGKDSGSSSKKSKLGGKLGGSSKSKKKGKLGGKAF
jgi:predicted GNAT family acetyltransferase